MWARHLVSRVVLRLSFFPPMVFLPDLDVPRRSIFLYGVKVSEDLFSPDDPTLLLLRVRSSEVPHDSFSSVYPLAFFSCPVWSRGHFLCLSSSVTLLQVFFPSCRTWCCPNTGNLSPPSGLWLRPLTFSEYVNVLGRGILRVVSRPYFACLSFLFFLPLHPLWEPLHAIGRLLS